jgi:putative molybdopterin biosynthesis protein
MGGGLEPDAVGMGEDFEPVVADDGDEGDAGGLRGAQRQRGSGTRLAFERLLADQGIERSEIAGFYSEEFTHLAVAAAVASGMADVGLGIEAAAKKLRLDFIPLFTEDYYLLAKKETLEQKNVTDLVEMLQSPAFRALVEAIPGYDASGAGTIRTLGEA